MIRGLPPGPIANLGAAALDAALRPMACKDLYFVSRNDGTTVFCPDLKCHNANVQKFQVDYFRHKRDCSRSGGRRWRRRIASQPMRSCVPAVATTRPPTPGGPPRFQGAPSKRCWHSAVWTGKEMIIWGGGNGTQGFNDGGRYDPSPTPGSPSAPKAPPARGCIMWRCWSDVPASGNCGSGEMIVWGGAAREGDAQSEYFQDGARYNPDTDTWKPITTQGAPKGRILTKAVWTGHELLLWGGVNDAQGGGVDDAGRYVGSGGRYNPATDLWTPISKGNGASPRLASGVWTGEALLLFGGWNGTHLNDTWLYSPARESYP